MSPYTRSAQEPFAQTAAVDQALTQLSSAVDALCAVSPVGWYVEELQAVLGPVTLAADRLRGWADRTTAALAASLPDGKIPTSDGGSRSLPGWLAETTRTSSGVAGSRLRTSGLLRRALPKVADAVVDGVLTPEQAAVLARLVGKISDTALAESQDDLITVAKDRDPFALAQWVRHQIATHCEPQLDADEAAAHAARYLQTRRENDGSLRGSFRLAGGDSEVLTTVIEALSRRDGLTDERSAGQRRADALVEICEQAARHGELPDHGGHRPQLSYVLPADWAARNADRERCPDCTSCPTHRRPSFADTVLAARADYATGSDGTTVPAEHACATAAWTGPATRARIETILCDARISRVLLDEVGQVRGLETLGDTVTPRQRRALAARDLGCVARGCTRPPAMCDAHHLDHLADGGATEMNNLVLLCRRHHVLWHLGKITRYDLHIPWHAHATSNGPPGAGPPGAGPPGESGTGRRA